MSKTEALCRAIASIAVCVTGVLIAQAGGNDWGCFSIPLIIFGLGIVWEGQRTIKWVEKWTD